MLSVFPWPMQVMEQVIHLKGDSGTKTAVICSFLALSLSPGDQIDSYTSHRGAK